MAARAQRPAVSVDPQRALMAFGVLLFAVGIAVTAFGPGFSSPATDGPSPAAGDGAATPEAGGTATDTPASDGRSGGGTETPDGDDTVQIAVAGGEGGDGGDGEETQEEETEREEGDEDEQESEEEDERESDEGDEDEDEDDEDDGRGPPEDHPGRGHGNDDR